MSNSRIVLNEKDRVGDWVAQQVGRKVTWGSFYAMGVETDGDITSGLVFANFSETNASAHIAVTKANKKFSKLLDYGHFYAFELCKLRRLTGLTHEHNTRAIAVNESIGWVREGIMKQAGTDGQDVVTLVLWPENYRKGKGRRMKDHEFYATMGVSITGNTERSTQNV